MTGVAAWEIWRKPDVTLRHHHALMLWFWQLGLKALWAPVFFGLHFPAGGLALGIVILGGIGFTTVRFMQLNRRAGLLMLPYAGWVAFEIYLTAGFWWLNS